MLKDILITGGTSKIAVQLKKLIPKSYNIYSPTKMKALKVKYFGIGR